MKKSTLLVLVSLIILLPCLVLADSIQGSKHDFSFGTSGTPFGKNFLINGVEIDDICVFCHTPHSANTDSSRELSTLLWNRSYSSSLTYDVSSSPTLDVAPDNPPKGISLMCMSCHDGITSIAVNTLLNAPGSGNPAITVAGGSHDKIGQVYDGGALG